MTDEFARPIESDDLGPESVLFVHDHETGMRGVLVVDCSVLGPCGGGTRMMPDLTAGEVAALARSMTYKFGILGLPRGGSKAGLWGDPSMPPEKKKRIMQAFGRRLRPFLASNFVAVGPDMGVTVKDVGDIYEGAGLQNARSGLFARSVEGDPAAYHITGYGVVSAARAAMASIGRKLEGASVAVEGFGQVGVGTARYAAKLGAKVVAISTLKGAIYHPNGLDIASLLEMRRTLGDDCVLEYKDAEYLTPSAIYYLPVDLLVPGARPYVIDEGNQAKIAARLVVSGGNITLTDGAYQLLHDRGVVCVPDFISNSGAAIASWVDFLAGDFSQALATIDRLIGPLTTSVLNESSASGRNSYQVARQRVHERIAASRGRAARSFDETKMEIRQLFGM